jgi:hypothetical protein
MLYLIAIEGGLHPTVHGPYGTEPERERAREYLKSIDDPEADQVLYATTDAAGQLTVEE